jgi:hypothetical protein
MVILADGTVVPCCNDYSARNPLGDLKTQTLREIWNGSEMRKLRRMLANPQSDRTGKICEKCPFPVSGSMDAELGLGLFNPAEEHVGLYCVNSIGTPSLDASFHKLVHVRLDECARQLFPGELVSYDVTVANRSSIRLGSNGQTPVHLSYHWLHPPDNSPVIVDGVRSKLIPDLPALSEHSYSVRVIAPDQEGSYRLQICLVQEGIAWLDHEASSCLIDVEVKTRFSQP